MINKFKKNILNQRKIIGIFLQVRDSTGRR